MIFDTIVILSHEILADGSLSSIMKQRLDYGIKLFKKTKVKNLILSGGLGHPNSNYNRELALVMREYVVFNGVPKENILLEKKSCDTVGQAIFLIKEILIPKSLKNVIVVSSKSHLPRVKVIFDFIGDKKIKFKYDAADSEKLITDNIIENEKNSLLAFWNTFDGIERGNIEKIYKRLFTKHPYYRK